MDIDDFIKHIGAGRRRFSAESLKAYRSDLKLFRQFLQLKGLRITQVNSAALAEYIKHMETVPNPRFGKLGLSEASITRRVVAIRRYYEYLRATSNPRLKDPTRGFKFRNPNNDECKAISEEAVQRLVNGVCSLRDRALILLLLSSGLRISEIHQLDRHSIDVQDNGPEDGGYGGTGTVIGKRSKKRSFYFDSEALEALSIYLATRMDDCPALFISERRQRMSRRAIQERVAYWSRRVGMEQVHPHQFRHCYGTRLANVGIDSMVLKELMGHDDLRTTNRYTKLEERTKARQYFAAMERWHQRKG